MFVDASGRVVTGVTFGHFSTQIHLNFMHRHHVCNVLYFITVHCIIFALCSKTWAGVAPMIWEAKAPMGAQTQQTDDSRKSD